MKYKTTRFGEVDIDENTIITFPEGIIGFEDCKRFVILGGKSGRIFYWLQSLDDPNLAFVIVSPYDFKAGYSLEITEPDAEFLGAKSPEDLQIYAIVVVPEDPSKMTANLQAPLVINVKNRIARQIISNNPEHKLRHYILEEMKNIHIVSKNEVR